MEIGFELMIVSVLLGADYVFVGRGCSVHFSSGAPGLVLPHCLLFFRYRNKHCVVEIEGPP